MVVFLATTVSTAPVEGKNTSHVICLCWFYSVLFYLWRWEILLCIPEKEQEEVEVETTEEVEGELSEEEEGRPVCVRNLLLFWKCSFSDK